MPTATRIDFRLDGKTKALIEQAAALSRQSVTEFAKSVLTRKAQDVLEEQRVIRLSERDHRAFMAALDANIEPNAALKRAARRYNEKSA